MQCALGEKRWKGAKILSQKETQRSKMIRKKSDTEDPNGFKFTQTKTKAMEQNSAQNFNSRQLCWSNRKKDSIFTAHWKHTPHAWENRSHTTRMKIYSNKTSGH